MTGFVAQATLEFTELLRAAHSYKDIFLKKKKKKICLHAYVLHFY